jgi:glycosyltransferase involved in cell wall biosynthesis
VARAEPPTFDLVVATVDRVEEPERLLASLERQTHRGFRVLLVDQNADERLEPVVRRHEGLDVTRLRSGRGLSAARNAALTHLQADIVAFPDDDCVYADDLLERVAHRFESEPALDGLTGREVDAGGDSSPSWDRSGGALTRANLWNRAISFSIFLRRTLVERIGAFDEQLGLGAGTAWSSGEEIEYLVRAVGGGARIEYDPSIAVTHDGSDARRPLAAVGRRDGASVGYILRKHGYPLPTVARMLVRPAGGVALAVLRRDRDTARFHAETLRGRVTGYRAAAAR